MKLSLFTGSILAIWMCPAIILAEEETDPAEIAIGERLTLETRFSQPYYASKIRGDNLRGILPNRAINCRLCHLVDDQADKPSGGMRSYSNFTALPPVPPRNDDKKTSVRNSMSMVNIARSWSGMEQGALFHYDGQFNSIEELVEATFTGRNFGWKADENRVALKHIATVIRNDDGVSELAQEFGGSYQKILKGTDPDIKKEFRLPAEYRIDVDKSSDQQILNALAKLVGAYVNNLSFAQDEAGNYTGSPYDVFLKKNNLPAQPAKNENTASYNLRLLKAINQLSRPQFVSEKDGKFTTHKQAFVFGKKELQGMKLFFRQGSANKSGGNCASCHAAPHFSDFSFHNTGLTQVNYDNLHGTGSFMKLAIPGLEQRNDNYNAFLPATKLHPNAASTFRQQASKEKPGMTDLGLWNVFANPDMPAPQEKLTRMLCSQANHNRPSSCNKQDLLDLSISSFKTPVLRDLGHSDPYMHTGQFSSLQDTIAFYIQSSAIAKSGKLRNADPALKNIALNNSDIANLVAFVKSLNEDYE